jgi:vacuolar-type H+-ATPase subunit F/Vma7
VSRVAAIGVQSEVRGYALAGVEVLEARSPDEARAALASLGAEVGLVILGPAAHKALAAELEDRPGLIWAVLPG